MPQRYAGPEDFSDLKALAKVSLDAVAFYTSVFFHVDDFGRLLAEPEILRAKAFPYRRDLRDTDCSRWLAECASAGLLAVYEVEGTPYLELVSYRDGRYKRAAKSRCPDPPRPPALARNCTQAPADANICPVPVTVTGTVIVDTPPTPPQAGGSSGSGGGDPGGGGRRTGKGGRKRDQRAAMAAVGTGSPFTREVDDNAPEVVRRAQAAIGSEDLDPELYEAWQAWRIGPKAWESWEFAAAYKARQAGAS